MLASVVGCSDPSTQWPDPKTDPTPLRTMKRAIDDDDWQRAYQYTDAVLRRYPNDIDVLIDLAKVAHVNEQPSRAADILIQACRVESFEKEPRVHQAMVALISAGRLFDAIDLLSEAVQAQPNHHEMRRTLFDLYVGTENRAASLEHGRMLVRKRQFDLELLKSLGNTVRRSLDPKPLEEVASRNPDDRRPMIGRARIQFDEGDYEDAIELLREIIETHPNFVPAHALLARSLSSAGRTTELKQWAETHVAGIQQHANYWLAIGDWARTQQHVPQAARAYWQATQVDADIAESWTKLGVSLKQLVQSGSEIPTQAIESVDRRATLLSKFNQQKSRFERTGEISREIATDIAGTLRELGRLWEAEAWAAMATTLPADDAVPVEETRNEIISLLRKNTPWQSTQQHLELTLDLSYLPLPAIVGSSGIDTSANLDSQRETSDADPIGATTPKLHLVNEASLRNLRFHGATADDLDLPGIMLHETLGCGGGTLDFDLDGWSDLYLVAAGGKPPERDSDANALYRNLGGSFSAVTMASGTGDTGFGQGVAVGDVNEDGFPDLFILNYGPNTLLINNGDGSFSDATLRLPSESTSQSWSTSGAIADLDNDGISDLVILHYCAGLEPSTQPCGNDKQEIPRSCSPMKFPAERDRFYRGVGDGSFVDATDQWSNAPSVLGRGLGVVVGALDDTRGLDILVANDMTQNHYWRGNAETNKFKLSESAIAFGLAGDDRSTAQGSMGIATSDFDRDGDLDFYVTNFDREYNTLYEQVIPGQWQDRTAMHDLIQPTLPLVGFGTATVDLDHNGQAELIVSNGHVDMFSREGKKSVYAHPMQIFGVDPNHRFASLEHQFASEYLALPHVGRALWTLDANRDHQTDIAVTHQTEPIALLINRNHATGTWIEFELTGTVGARDAIGAKIEIQCGDDRWVATLTSGDGYLCSNERIMRIGLGDTTENCDITVTWPNQSQQTWSNVATKRNWLLVQDAPEAFSMP
ncbi:ASPIC/UnbV domain protein [Rhodopirellula maiorica SM1]|uniref:ASPIC/UnbV domain protein n=1 Tax=Rhodopirellula maiorica SM1 TaxID=1265738 RepID=M5RPR0_9BACT|nr:CRTAC1 family protein [Rhodopirellula maiorica]EMI21308.1 ASPIC/UnbV domain protein [Rhodopirellula maiorica SM1]